MMACRAERNGTEETISCTYRTLRIRIEIKSEKNKMWINYLMGQRPWVNNLTNKSQFNLVVYHVSRLQTHNRTHTPNRMHTGYVLFHFYFFTFMAVAAGCNRRPSRKYGSCFINTKNISNTIRRRLFILWPTAVIHEPFKFWKRCIKLKESWKSL